jgi:hypothetical protein
MIKIDFNGSTHGHFLEFISNVYIMQTTDGNSLLFNENGAAHSVTEEYLSNRLIFCGHWSRDNPTFDSSDRVIRISIDKFNDKLFYIAFINLLYRAGDVGLEQQLANVPEKIRNNHVLLRNDFYSKFYERDLYVNQYSNFLDIGKIPTFDFPFESFYDFDKFCIQLNELANFLNRCFFPDKTLYTWWAKFIELNQGWNSHKKCSNIIQNIFNDVDFSIDCSVFEQAWINFNLSKSCRLYSGSLFENIDYPINCQEMYSLIQTHLNTMR